MWMISSSVRIFLYREATDMRKSFDGLCALTREILLQEPCNGSLFVFRNRRKNRVKILYCDRSGMAIWYKRLEQGTFSWPLHHAVVEMNAADLMLILEGIDLIDARRRKRVNIALQN